MKCNQCDGTGYVLVDEPGRGLIQDACYHCGNTGRIDAETDFADRLRSMAESLSEDAEWKLVESSRNDPEEDSYALCAAENGLTLRDYLQGRAWARADAMLEEWAKLPRERIAIMLGEYENARRRKALTR